MKLSIIHLTDLHAKNRIDFLNEKVRDIVLKINNCPSDNILLLFSGDLSNSGEKQQFNVVSSFIKQIKANSYKKIHIASCAGNHDRSFNEDQSLKKETISQIDCDNYLEYLNKFITCRQAYDCFEQTLVGRKKINDILSVFDFLIDGKVIRVFSLDNSILSHFDRSHSENSDTENFENIIIPKDLLNIKRGNSFLCFLVMHAPLYFLEEKTRENLIAICNKHIDIIFDGHKHEENILKDCGDKTFLEFASSALHDKESSGFTFLNIDNNRINYSHYYFNDEDRKYELINQRANRSMVFDRKINSFNDLVVNKEHVDYGIVFKTTNNFEIDLNESFVFPMMTTSSYFGDNKKSHILSFDHFKDVAKKYRIIQISSEDGMGKTSLANRLFHLFIEDGFLPVLCCGSDFAGYKKNKNKLKNYINNQICLNYKGNNPVSVFMDKQCQNKRILIVDDFDSFSEDMVKSILEVFDKIIFFVGSKIQDFITYTSFGNISFIKLRIEPMYQTKREELFEKIYDIVKRRKKDLEDEISKENYISTFETYISKLDKNNMIDPRTIIELSCKVLVDVRSFDDANNLRYQDYYYDHSIESVVASHHFEKCNIYVANRIIARTAFYCYEQKLNTFQPSIFKKAIEEEKEKYGGDVFSDCQAFSDILCEANILKKVETNSTVEYSFEKRKVFAYFVGKYAMNLLHSFNDSSALNMIIENGIYSPLNFNILMSIATNYSYHTIPNYFVNDLHKEIMGLPLDVGTSANGLIGYFKEDKERLLNISKEERKRIKKSISVQEEKNRNEYLKNADNYFYIEQMDSELTNIIDLINKMKIVSVLLGASNMVLKEEKSKLADIVIKLPNVIIEKYISLTKKEIDRIYVEIQEMAKSHEEITQTDIDDFFDYLISLVTSVVLTIYDTSSRYLGSSNISKELLAKIDAIGDDSSYNMHAIQRLMLLSFTNKELFTSEVTKFIKENKNIYYCNQARLIARRFYFDNEEYVNKNKKGFLESIGGFTKMKIIGERNKRIKK